jgi:hypothetical protein
MAFIWNVVLERLEQASSLESIRDGSRWFVWRNLRWRGETREQRRISNISALVCLILTVQEQR